MSNAQKAVSQIHALAADVQQGSERGAIDWMKILNLLIQILPIIAAIFAEEQTTTKKT